MIRRFLLISIARIARNASNNEYIASEYSKLYNKLSRDEQSLLDDISHDSM